MSTTYTYTGSKQTFDASNAAVVRLIIDGARGEDGESGETYAPGDGERGGHLQGTVDVNDLDELGIYVGGGRGSRWGFHQGGIGGSGAGDGGNGAGETSVRDANDNLLGATDGGGGGGGGSSSSQAGGGGGGGAAGGPGGSGDQNGTDGEGTGQGGAGGDSVAGSGGGSPGEAGGVRYDSSLDVEQETVGGSSSGEHGTVEIEVLQEAVEAPENLTATPQSDSEIGLEWVEPGDGDSVRIYRSDEPGVTQDTSNLIDEIGMGFESYTDTALEMGKTYYYAVSIRWNDDTEETELSNEADGTTDLPDVTGFALDASTQDELTVELEEILDRGEYRVRWKRSSITEYDSEDEVTIPYDFNPLEYTITPVLDGEKYDISVRTETEDVDGEWHTAEEITKLVSVSGISFKPLDSSVEDYNSDIEATWTIESDYEGAQQIWRREIGEEYDDEKGDLIATVDNATEAYTAASDAHDIGRDYEYTIRTQTDYVHADSSETFVTSRAGLQAALYAEIDDPTRTDPITIDPPKAIQNATIRHSATSNIDIATQDLGPELRTLAQANPDVDLRTRLLDSAGNEVRDDRIIKGVLGEVETQGESDEATLKTKGRGWYLENNTPDNPVQIQNQQVWEAIRDYGETELTGWDVDVTPDAGAPIATDEVGQSADTQTEWVNFLETYIEGEPFWIDNGKLKQAQTCFLGESPGPIDPPGTATPVASDDYSDGNGVEFNSSGEYMSYPEFDVNHTILSNNVGVAARVDVPAADDGENASVELQLRDADTNDVVHAVTIYSGSGGTNPLWRGFGSDGYISFVGGDSEWTGPDIEAGTYYWRLVCTGSPFGDGSGTVVDIFAVFDSRYGYTWDNFLHEDAGYLDGPEEYANVPLELPLVERETNIDRAEISSVWNNTNNQQALALTNDGGDNWVEQSNTSDLVVQFSDEGLFGTMLRARLAFSRYPMDTPQESTPRYGYEGQSVDSYELRFDQSSVAVIDETTLSDSHKENLNTLVDRGRMVWAIDHTADGKVLNVFPIGTDNGGVDWTTKDWSRSDGSFQYANRVIARGARKPEEERENEDDLRYEAEVTDDEEIQQRLDDGLPEDKATQTTVILDPELSTQDEVNSTAFSALEDLVENRLASGSVDVVPTFIPPGYAYKVPEFEDENGETPTKVLEQVSLSMGYDSATGTLQFEEPQNWVTALNPIEGDVGGLKRLF